MSKLFTANERDAVRDRVIELAEADSRVVAAAIVGSLALGGGDHWSDLDLTFAVADEVPVADVLEDWTARMVEEFDAVTLFDLPARGTIYRVFLLPRWLQVDLSFTPASDFHAASPRFKPVFGAYETRHPPPPSARDLLGWAVVYARHARVCVDRHRWWQAEFCVSAVRDHALMLACLRRELPTGFGRAFDDLPAAVGDAARDAIVRSLDRDELLRALSAAVDALLDEADQVPQLAAHVEPQLRALVALG